MRHRPGGTADGMTTEHEIRDALALFPSLKLEKCTLVAGGDYGAYVVVTHINGSRWLISVPRVALESGGAPLVQDIAARVARCMIDDAMELLRPSVTVISRGAAV